ncbi:DNA mismatch repair endonuclease MutL [Alteromonadaceae bacterium BrNp21-10]|nr:DNA mismatch repair endonuclease MutL [Alteromonadaceae bacterium BrNp21-10]
MSIQVLPAMLANQIAAGEVVERPASVVKELIENSLDAGATKIEIDIERGGHKRLCVRDNGSGIAKDQLALALCRHATSKISCLDDLEHIASLGFRGEALASISSVSRLTLTSKTVEQDSAWQAQTQGNEMAVDIIPAAHPVGTSIDVQDLFFNTPARRKFLRAEKTEFSHIDDIVKRIALSRFDVHFMLKHNGKLLRRYNPITQLEDQPKRIAAVCDKQFAENILQLSSEYQHFKLHGWIDPSFSQLNHQYFYVNGRMMRDKLLNHAIKQASHEVSGSDVPPDFVLYLDLPVEQVDINVHPAKHEVRFHQSRLIHDFIYRAIVDVFKQAPVNAHETASVSGGYTPSEPQHQYIKQLQPDYQNTPNAYGTAPTNTQRPSSGGYSRTAVSRGAALGYQQLMTSTVSDNGQASIPWLFTEGRYFVIALEGTSVLDICWLLQQQLASEISNQQLVSQPLLMPMSIEVAEKVQRAEQHQELFASLGIHYVCVKQRLMLRQVPAILRSIDWAHILPSLLDVEFTDAEALVIALFAAIRAKAVNFSQQQATQQWQWARQFYAEQWPDCIKQQAKSVSVQQWMNHNG